jgi:hypothetical protein
MKMSSPVEITRQNSAFSTEPKCRQARQLGPLAASVSQLAKNCLSQHSWSQWMLSAFAALAIIAFASGRAVAAPPQKLPPLKDVMAYVDRHFANTTHYKPGDIISTSNVTSLFDGLELIGWKVPDQKQLLERVPSDKDYVVQQLRTEQGRKFMQQICNLPLGYDRLFHLSGIPRGHQQVHDLIRLKDGYKMIEYMTTTQMGKNLGTQLSHTPNGADFNKATGQIYTAEALKIELEKSYAITLQALGKAKK